MHSVKISIINILWIWRKSRFLKWVLWSRSNTWVNAWVHWVMKRRKSNRIYIGTVGYSLILRIMKLYSLLTASCAQATCTSAHVYHLWMGNNYFRSTFLLAFHGHALVVKVNSACVKSVTNARLRFIRRWPTFPRSCKQNKSFRHTSHSMTTLVQPLSSQVQVNKVNFRQIDLHRGTNCANIWNPLCR